MMDTPSIERGLRFMAAWKVLNTLTKEASAIRTPEWPRSKDLDQAIDRSVSLLVPRDNAQYVDFGKRITELEFLAQDLLDAIPPQSDDADWWPDSLRRAVDAANGHLDKFYGADKYVEVE